ncbi:MAG: nickel pincer cofactor biosynthesis protein LarB [Deltaproteobacteria bacterium]|nr:nickel pincer cofactor biosynthesis protein LarB [Deltaproteobacteria bacterium]
MKPKDIEALLESVAAQETTVADALRRLRALPFEDLGFARLDHHRELRTGVPEAILGSHKRPHEIAALVEAMRARGQTAIVTRVTRRKSEKVFELLSPALRSECTYEPLPRLFIGGNTQEASSSNSSSTSTPKSASAVRGRGTIAVVTAGTSDRWVGEEAARIAELLGNHVERVFDVGVAGLHRVLAVRDQLDAAEVVIVVAGMEGALPSVLKGLISRPIIAVPTSVGFGTGRHGRAALLGMLNACTPGITVVNIDNGFGAGYAASLINRKRSAIES